MPMELTYFLVATFTMAAISYKAARGTAPFSLLLMLTIGLTATSFVRLFVLLEALRTKSSNSPDVLFYLTEHQYQAYGYVVVFAVALSAG